MTSFNETDADNVNGLLMRGGFHLVDPSVVYSVLSAQCGGNYIAAATFISDQHAEAFPALSSASAKEDDYNDKYPALPRKDSAGNTNGLRRPSPLPLPSIRRPISLPLSSISSRDRPTRSRRPAVGMLRTKTTMPFN